MTLPYYEPTDFAAKIFKDRYPIHPEETFDAACKRVAHHIAGAEEGVKRAEWEKRFFKLLRTNRFSAGGRIWRGCGRPRGQMLNCFVIDDDIDSREGWGETFRNVAVISGLGGGVGINFSKVRPRGCKIRGTGGEATGAVSLMMAVNAVCEELREGGGRRSALMFCLKYDHPDLPEFLNAKLDQKRLNNANVSVLIDNTFLKLLDEDGEVVFKWQNEDRGRMKARDIWNRIVEHSWKCGEPGVLNIGYANEMNNIWYAHQLTSTNPCGEIWLPPFDSCDLGAINLATHARHGKIDWDLLAETVTTGVRFLDDVLDRNHYPLPRIAEMGQKFRRIGLGVMGLHDMLLEMGIKYSSPEALTVIDEILAYIKKKAYQASIFLAVEKGPFPGLDREKFLQSGFCKRSLTPGIRSKILEYGIRNCALLTIAPTGTTSIVAGVSGGIEPMFAPVYRRNFNIHAAMHDADREKGSEVVVHPLLKRFLTEGRSIDHFEGAHEISPEHHLAVQQVCQRHVDNSISKTINMPEDYPVEKLEDIMRANISTLKGMTIYRNGSRGKSPLMPVPISEAKDLLAAVSGAATSDCPNSLCEVSLG